MAVEVGMSLGKRSIIAAINFVLISPSKYVLLSGRIFCQS